MVLIDYENGRNGTRHARTVQACCRTRETSTQHSPLDGSDWDGAGSDRGRRMTYFYNAKPKALTEREELLGMTPQKKSGVTITEPKDFLDMIETLQKKCDWSNQGIKEPSFNQTVFFCVKVVHDELIDQLNGKLPID